MDMDKKRGQKHFQKQQQLSVQHVTPQSVVCDVSVSSRFITVYKCTNTLLDERVIEDSHLSFPSGHASMSMFSAMFTVVSNFTLIAVV